MIAHFSILSRAHFVIRPACGWPRNCFGFRDMPYQPSPERARTHALQNRTFKFACAVIRAYPKTRPLDDPSRIIWRELIKAAGSSTFNLEEADGATSDGDFVAKMRIRRQDENRSSGSKRGPGSDQAHCRLRTGESCTSWKTRRRSQSACFDILNHRAEQEGEHEEEA